MKHLLFLSLFLLLLPSMAFSDPLDDVKEEVGLKGKSWSVLTWENDMFVFSDDGYSNGISFSWGKGPFDSFESTPMPDWISTVGNWTHINNFDDRQYAVGYHVGQTMHTPEDLSSEEYIEDDRPYIGLLLWVARLRSFDDNVSDSAGLTIGVAGPASLAEQSQKIIHKITGSEEPKGWDNQISNEMVFRLNAERIYRLGELGLGDTIAIDANFYSQAGLGNLRSDVGAGMVFRIGTHLAETFYTISPTPARGANTMANSSSAGFNWQIMTALYGTYIFNDITVDGNTFKDSYSLDLINEQAIASIALNVGWNNWGLLLSLQSGTDTYEEQISASKYGALSITYHH